ncbi:hypothetical protein [Agromyces sp. ZXT2-6]|uniref:hypothetical protein n=1 Tax=Agromyces sp. ZXT2-6 TaxID=3461153 RepID=UPI004054CB01
MDDTNSAWLRWRMRPRSSQSEVIPEISSQEPYAQFIKDRISPNMYLTVNGYYDEAPSGVPGWAYYAGGPMLWGYFSGNIANRAGVIG